MAENPGLDIGTLQDKIGAAQDLYNTSLEGLINNNFATGALSALGDPVAGAAQAASSFVATGTTVLGAVNTIGGLISAAEHGSPAQVAQAFSGALIGLVEVGIATGAITAGAGAAICAAIAIVAEVAEAIFGTPSPGYTIGNCILQNPPPGWTVGIVYPQAPSSISAVLAGPSSKNWRHFPLNPAWGRSPGNDSLWFVKSPANDASNTCHNSPCNPNWLFNWGTLPGEVWAQCANGARPIDSGFPKYHQLECDIQAANRLLYTLNYGFGEGGTPVIAGFSNGALPPQLRLTADDQSWLSSVGNDVAYALMRLTKAYFAAWCINSEYVLNGLGTNAQNGSSTLSDSQVLIQVVNHWNSAHAPGVGYELAAPQGKTSSNSTALAWTDCSSIPIASSYIHLLVGDLKNSNTTLTGGETLHINTGPLLNPPNTLVGSGATVPGTLLHTPTASTSMSTGGKVATALAVGGGVALVGSAVYAHMTRQALSSVWRGWYNTARRKL
jgi:hypothetical protein